MGDLTLDDLPGPRRLPGLGNVLSLRADRMHSTLERWCERYGAPSRFDIGRRPVVCVADPSAINVVLRERPEGFRRWTVLQDVMNEMAVDGVFTAEGEDWHRQRRLAVTALNAAHLHRYYGVISAATDRLSRRLDAATRSGAGTRIDTEFATYTIDVTTSLAFGVSDDAEAAELQPHISTIFRMISRRVNLPFPYWRVIRLPADRALDRSLTRVIAAVDGFIAEARARVAARPELAERPENFLEGMIAAQQSEGRYSDRELVGNTLTMLLAGEDTTSHTLAWASWLLACHPAAQERVAREADEVFGNEPLPPDAESADRLTYTDAVIRETLRLKSVTPVFFVEAINDTTVDGVQIPAGTSLVLMTRTAGMQDTSFADPTTFKPERWLDSELGPHDPRAFLSFGAGPRFCPGRNLALLEGKTALAAVARNYEISLDESHGPPDERFGLTMSPENLWISLKPRELALRASTP